VDEGKLKWDDPVTKYLPKFQLYDPYATREMTIRDLLCHRSGLDSNNVSWYGSPASREEVLYRLRYVKPASSFRSTFGYQNIMFLAAGQIIPAVTGRSWDEFLKERIFQPLGMVNSDTSITALPKNGDVAMPHHKVKDKLQPIPYRNIDNIGPAGSINSSVADMAQWVRLQLNEGARPKEKDRLLSSGVMQTMHTPQTVIPMEGAMAKLNPETHLMAYGLGWLIQDYRGKKLLSHSGGIDGMNAQVALLPEEKLGLVVLANRDGTRLPQLLMYRLFDSYLHAPARDWSAEELKLSKDQEEKAKKEEKRRQEERVKDTRPSLALEKYAGTYHSDSYGEIKIVPEKGQLVAHFGPSFVGDLEHWHYDTFRVTWRDPTFPQSMLTFALNGRAKVEELKANLMGASELPFKRMADPKAASGASVE
jgi:CubicO group peptidase (beta-lactamase class C family)